MNQESKEEKIENTNSELEVINENKQNKKIKGIAFLIIALIIFLIIVFAYATFEKISLSKVYKISQDNALSNLYTSLKKDIDSSKQVDTTINVDTEKLSTLFGDFLNYGMVSIQNKNLRDDNDASGKISLLIDDKELISADYAKTDDTYGIAISSLFNNYIAVENNNLRELYKKINTDVTDEELAEVPDRIEAEDFENTGKEELMSIAKKYVSTLAKFYGKNAKIFDNVAIDVCGKNLNTTEYELKIDNQSACKLFVDLLDIAKDDEDLYNFIKKYDVKGHMEYNNYGEWRESVINTREEIKNDIKNKDYGDGIVLINVYACGNSAVRYELKIEEFETLNDASLTFDTIEANGNVLGTLRYCSSGDYKSDYSIGISIGKSSKEYKVTCNLKIEISDFAPVNLEFATLTINCLNKNDIEFTKLTSENTLVLNTATDEELEKLSGEIKGNILTLIADVIKNLPQNVRERLLENESMEEE